MRRLCLWLVFFVMLGIQSAFAQSYVVKGNVVSKLDNEPLIGVSVMQKGTANGAVTDMDGNYELKIQGGEATLVFSYIGMRSQELPVNSRTGVLNVALEDDSQLMNEVVVVAYGVRKKGTIAGSVSMVQADKMENVPAPSFDQALQGQAPGLSVISSSGEPSKPYSRSVVQTLSTRVRLRCLFWTAYLLKAAISIQSVRATSNRFLC